MNKTFILLLILILPILLNGKNIQKENDSTSIITPEGIGKYLSELLINRQNLEKSSIMIDINNLSSREDWSENEDNNSVEAMLSFLSTQQIVLPLLWNKLLFEADSLHIDTNAKYIKTYFHQIDKNQFVATAVIESKSQYFALVFSLIEWENKQYIAKIGNQLPAYNNLYELKLDNFSGSTYRLDEDDIDDLKSVNSYVYNDYQPNIIENIYSPSLKPLLDELTSSIELSKNLDSTNLLPTKSDLLYTLSSIPDKVVEDNHLESEVEKKELEDAIVDNYNRKLENSWREFLDLIKDKDISNLDLNNVSINNIYFDRDNVYSVFLEYKYEIGYEVYVLSCYSVMIDNKWKIFNIDLRK